MASTDINMTVNMVSGWRPADDAPIDETVLVWGEPFGGCPPMFAVGVRKEDGWYAGDYTFGWYEAEGVPGFDDIENVTHFMPLPPPPETGR